MPVTEQDRCRGRSKELATQADQSRSHVANAVLTLGAVAFLFGERGTAHTLGLLGWITVVLASIGGLWVGWTGALAYIHPETSPRRTNSAAVLFGLIVGLALIRVLGPEKTGAPAIVWPAGAFFAWGGVGFYTRYFLDRVKREHRS